MVCSSPSFQCTTPHTRCTPGAARRSYVDCRRCFLGMRLDICLCECIDIECRVLSIWCEIYTPTFARFEAEPVPPGTFGSSAACIEHCQHLLLCRWCGANATRTSIFKAKNPASSSGPDVTGPNDQAHAIALQIGMINDMLSHDISHSHIVCTGACQVPHCSRAGLRALERGLWREADRHRVCMKKPTQLVPYNNVNRSILELVGWKDNGVMIYSSLPLSGSPTALHVLRCFEDVRVAVIRMQLLFTPTTPYVLPMKGATFCACEHCHVFPASHVSIFRCSDPKRPVWNIIIEPDEKCELDEDAAVTDGQLEMSLSIAEAI
eukprot:4881555-Amphidinium_carterae.1